MLKAEKVSGLDFVDVETKRAVTVERRTYHIYYQRTGGFTVHFGFPGPGTVGRRVVGIAAGDCEGQAAADPRGAAADAGGGAARLRAPAHRPLGRPRRHRRRRVQKGRQ